MIRFAALLETFSHSFAGVSYLFAGSNTKPRHAFVPSKTFAITTAGYSSLPKSTIMNEIIQQVVQKTGISPEKAQEVLQTISSFVSQKFPHLAGPLTSVLGGGTDSPKSDQGAGTGSPLGEIGGKLGF